MDSKKSVIFFAVIVTASCLLSDTIHDNFVYNCHVSEPQLEPLELVFCKTAGDRGVPDILCNGIYQISVEMCSNSSSPTLDEVMTRLDKLPKKVEDFCKYANSLNEGGVNVHKNISENLKRMKSSSEVCSKSCDPYYDGQVNPLCTFLVSYSLQKRYVVPKSENVSNIAPKKTPISNTVEEVSAAKPNKTSNVAKSVNTINTKSSGPTGHSVPILQSNDNPQESLLKSKQNSDVELNPPDTEHKPSDPEQKPLDADFPSSDTGQKQPQPLDENLNRNSTPENEYGNNLPNRNDDFISGENPANGGALESPSNKDPIHELGVHETIKDPFENAGDSNFFTYFVFISAICICFYIAMYNKKKILALMIEGRRSSVKRRPNSAAYSKLDCTLEEAMASGPSTSSSNTLLY